MALADILRFGSGIGEQLLADRQRESDLDLFLEAPEVYAFEQQQRQLQQQQQDQDNFRRIASSLPSIDPFQEALARIGGATGDFSDYAQYGQRQTLTPLQRAQLANQDMESERARIQQDRLSQLAQTLPRETPTAGTFADLAAITGDVTPYFDYIQSQQISPFQQQSLELQRLQEDRLNRQAQLAATRPAIGRSTGVERVASQLREENPDLSYADSVSLAATITKTAGTTYNPETGAVESVAGFGDVVGDISGRRSAGTQAGKTVQQDVSDSAFKLRNLKVSTDAFDNLLNQQGLTIGTGRGRTIKQVINPQDVANFQAELDRVLGVGFVTAVQSLRGLGQLSDAEGAKLVQSYTSLSTAQDPKTFKRELERLIEQNKVFRKQVQSDIEVARQRAEAFNIPVFTPSDVQGDVPVQQGQGQLETFEVDF